MPRAFFERDTVEVAVGLLGASLVSMIGGVRCSGRIVEVEAYGDGADLASHAARLKRGGVRSMSGPAGIAYVYRSYGIHAMFNVIAKRDGGTGAVLVRALEPREGLEMMRVRRGADSARALCSGPGKLCMALGITLALHGTDLIASDRLWIAAGEAPAKISAGERIGISRALDLPWRFFDAESAYISAHRRGVPLAAFGDRSDQSI